MEKSKDFIRRNGRKLYPFICDQCGIVAHRRQDHIKSASRVFCSLKCKGKSQETFITLPCNHCGKPTNKTPAELKKTKASYCSMSCSASLNNKTHKRGKKHHNYKNGASSYRAKALREFEHKCHNPGCLLILQLEKIPVEMLDVDHIDDDRSNNELSNLILLCVWCHTLKTRNIEVLDQ